MNPTVIWAAVLAALSIGTLPGEVIVSWEHNSDPSVTGAFTFTNLPPPQVNDAAAQAVFSLVSGERDRNGAGLDCLHDGRMPEEEDEPARNFFLRAGTSRGRVLLDLGKPIRMRQVNTYSWHPGSRGPQVYKLYGCDGLGKAFKEGAESGVAPEQQGWKLLAQVDTRPTNGAFGGQYGVSISDSTGGLGKYQYLLFDFSPTETRDPFGNTFFSEIDVVDCDAREAAQFVTAESGRGGRELVENGVYRVMVDFSETPSLGDWCRTNVVPMVRQWYPRLAAMLGGPRCPTNVTIRFSKDMDGVAATGGARVRCGARWFRANLEGEALGAIFHELVHVVQQYGSQRRTNPNAEPAPGWLVEGIADYYRWFEFEPKSHGAEVTVRSLARARYNSGYRITANFLNWVAGRHDGKLIQDLNSAIREGRYSSEFWKEHTGSDLDELGRQWKAALEKKLESKPQGSRPPPGA